MGMERISNRGMGACGVARVLLCASLLLLLGPGAARTQQLEPRAYAPAPTGLNFIGLGSSYSSGGVVTDPSLPILNVRARVYSMVPYYGRTFGLFGRLATATFAAPYGWAHITGDVRDVSASSDRSGFFDPRARFGVNLFGCPSLTPQAFAGRARGTNLGASISISAPLGPYTSQRLINLGTNRWTFKPELGLSQPLGAWIFELYAGVWLFQTNPDFYGGHIREQDPLAAYQTHLFYNISRSSWAAADFTFYEGGSTTVDGQANADRQSNTRGGFTLSVPCGTHQSLRAMWARGVSTRIGSSFQTVGLGWQLRWF
jgi:hypothetical protein